MKRAAILPSRGIGDALLMMIAAHRLLQEGFQVTTFHPLLPQLQEWFPGHAFETELPPLNAWINYDLIVAENDNSPFIHTLKETIRDRLSIFYPTYLKNKHGLLSPLDQEFEPTRPMADNIAKAAATLVNSSQTSKNNGLVVPSHLIHRKEKSRIVIHPTSSDPRKNWAVESFIQLAKHLKTRAFNPVFTVSEQELTFWEKLWSPVPRFPSLSDLAAFIYESGFVIGNDSLMGHLASNLHIPSLIIADSEKRMRLWRPGWLSASVVTPPSWIPNWKFFRLRDHYWQHWISKRRVLAVFENFFDNR